MSHDLFINLVLREPGSESESVKQTEIVCGFGDCLLLDLCRVLLGRLSDRAPDQRETVVGPAVVKRLSPEVRCWRLPERLLSSVQIEVGPFRDLCPIQGRPHPARSSHVQGRSLHWQSYHD